MICLMVRDVSRKESDLQFLQVAKMGYLLPYPLLIIPIC